MTKGYKTKTILNPQDINSNDDVNKAYQIAKEKYPNGEGLNPPCSSCGQIKNIVKGFGKWGWDSIASLFGGKPEPWIIERAEICAVCEYHTFLPVIEWAAKGIDLSKIIKLEGVFADADLPIDHEPGQLKMLWCSKCKCCIEAKIRVKDEKCPLDKW